VQKTLLLLSPLTLSVLPELTKFPPQGTTGGFLPEKVLFINAEVFLKLDI
jgi:hypothetical protein